MKESVFANEIKKAAAEFGCLYYKIPDSFNMDRFSPSKPYDSFLLHDGTFIALEFKMHQSKNAFPLDRVKDHQIEGLKDVWSHGGLGIIVLNVRYKGYNRAFFYDVDSYLYDKEFFLSEAGRKSIPIGHIEDSWTELKREKINESVHWNLEPLLKAAQFAPEP